MVRRRIPLQRCDGCACRRRSRGVRPRRTISVNCINTVEEWPETGVWRCSSAMRRNSTTYGTQREGARRFIGSAPWRSRVRGGASEPGDVVLQGEASPSTTRKRHGGPTGGRAGLAPCGSELCLSVRTPARRASRLCGGLLMVCESSSSGRQMQHKSTEVRGPSPES